MVTCIIERPNDYTQRERERERERERVRETQRGRERVGIEGYVLNHALVEGPICPLLHLAYVRRIHLTRVW